ncbi:MAG: ABC transporter permease [Muribaculaceae bacterium]|nr:ABC transporter permease [Muribaculaceae bacterium]
MKLITRLLRKNTSSSRIAGFILSNFLGLLIIVGGLQFYEDARSLWSSDDSFINNDILVVNKVVSTANAWDSSASAFTKEEIEQLKEQPWVREVGDFTSADYRIWASVAQGGRGMSTMLFFESVPDRFVDAAGSDWTFDERSGDVPIIISKDYLALYNFGFAGSAGLPQMSESILSGIPLKLTLTSDDGRRMCDFTGHVVGLSNRLNTILVPESFMKWSNQQLGSGVDSAPSRLIIDVSSPGDVAIKEYLEANNLEVAGDKSNSSASYLLNVVAAIVLAIGIVITVLSFFILLLSMSLLMEKNRDKLHSLLMLGCPLSEVSAPYVRIVVWATALAYVLASVGGMLLRQYYIGALRGLGAATGGWWLGLTVGFVLSVIMMAVNVAAVRSKVVKSWR